MKKRMIYSFRAGSRLPQEKAPIVGREIEALRKRNGRDPNAEDVLEAASKATSSLHEFFEWDDSKAAKDHRLWQARHLLGAIQVDIEIANGKVEQTRAFIALSNRAEDEDANLRRYSPVLNTLEDPELRARVLARALAELEGWQRRYQQLVELGAIFEAAQATKKRVAA